MGPQNTFGLATLVDAPALWSFGDGSLNPPVKQRLAGAGRYSKKSLQNILKLVGG